MNVALHMGEWHNFARLPKWPRSDAAVFLTAFGLTVVVDLTVAVEIGIVLAAMLFIKRVSETTQITAVDETTETEGPQHSLVGKEIPERRHVLPHFWRVLLRRGGQAGNRAEARRHRSPKC